MKKRSIPGRPDSFIQYSGRDIDFIKSQQKGDGYKIFNSFLQTKGRAFTDSLVQNRKAKVGSTSNWDDLKYAFPQLSWRNDSKLKTSGTFVEPASRTNIRFKSLKELENGVNSIDRATFRKTLDNKLGGPPGLSNVMIRDLDTRVIDWKDDVARNVLKKSRGENMNNLGDHFPNFAIPKYAIERRLAQENVLSRHARAMKLSPDKFTRTKFDFDEVMVSYPNSVKSKDLFFPDSVLKGFPTPLAKELAKPVKGLDGKLEKQVVDIITARASDSIPNIRSKLDQMGLTPGKIIATGDMYKSFKINPKTGQIININDPLPQNLQKTPSGRLKGFRNLKPSDPGLTHPDGRLDYVLMRSHMIKQ